MSQSGRSWNVVWLAFGAVAVAPAAENLTWRVALYAVLSLTVVRMAPVAVALVGARLGRPTIGLVAWFGPRGLASVVFALLALEELGSQIAGQAVAVITITVLLSVIAHGATADPLAARYAGLLAVQHTGLPMRSYRACRSAGSSATRPTHHAAVVRNAAEPGQIHQREGREQAEYRHQDCR